MKVPPRAGRSAAAAKPTLAEWSALDSGRHLRTPAQKKLLVRHIDIASSRKRTLDSIACFNRTRSSSTPGLTSTRQPHLRSMNQLASSTINAKPIVQTTLGSIGQWRSLGSGCRACSTSAYQALREEGHLHLVRQCRYGRGRNRKAGVDGHLAKVSAPIIRRTHSYIRNLSGFSAGDRNNKPKYASTHDLMRQDYPAGYERKSIGGTSLPLTGK